MNPTDLVAYCGGYCGHCDLARENVAFGLKLLEAINATFGPTQSVGEMGWGPMRKLGGYATAPLDQIIASLVDFPDCFPRGCTENCVPPCEIAQCASQKEYRTCAACDEADVCEKLDQARDAVAENLAYISTHGVEAFAREQAQVVAERRRERVMRILDESGQGGE